jgi:hypothetical protein
MPAVLADPDQPVGRPGIGLFRLSAHPSGVGSCEIETHRPRWSSHVQGGLSMAVTPPVGLTIQLLITGVA